jgi:hypothetical protein
MDGLGEIPESCNDQADQVLDANASLLEDAAQALRCPDAHAGPWRGAAAALAEGTAGWLRRVQHAGDDTGDEPPELPDLLI